MVILVIISFYFSNCTKSVLLLYLLLFSFHLTFVLEHAGLLFFFRHLHLVCNKNLLKPN